MNQKELKIIPPEGYEIDKENSTFECVRFKPIKAQLPKTWEEFCSTYSVKLGEVYINSASSISPSNNGCRRPLTDRNTLPSRKIAEAMLALCQLIQLRNYYNQGWEPDWKAINTPKACIIIRKDKATIETKYETSHILAFNTMELCTKFLENFKGLIEIAKPLL